MISKRLKLICDFVEKDSIVADIGTDHGLIPLYLSKNNISKKVIATDISKNSLSKLEYILESNSFINSVACLVCFLLPVRSMNMTLATSDSSFLVFCFVDHDDFSHLPIRFLAQPTWFFLFCRCLGIGQPGLASCRC